MNISINMFYIAIVVGVRPMPPTRRDDRENEREREVESESCEIRRSPKMFQCCGEALLQFFTNSQKFTFNFTAHR